MITEQTSYEKVINILSILKKELVGKNIKHLVSTRYIYDNILVRKFKSGVTKKTIQNIDPEDLVSLNRFSVFVPRNKFIGLHKSYEIGTVIDILSNPDTYSRDSLYLKMKNINEEYTLSLGIDIIFTEIEPNLYMIEE